jgi:hypothetical protein
MITQVLRPDAFKIADGDGRELANSWNIDQLRKFYVQVNSIHTCKTPYIINKACFQVQITIKVFLPDDPLPR